MPYGVSFLLEEITLQNQKEFDLCVYCGHLVTATDVVEEDDKMFHTDCYCMYMSLAYPNYYEVI